MGKVIELITPRDLRKAVDDLGKLRAEIKKLTVQEEQIERLLIGSGQDEIEGNLYRVTISQSTRSKTNWRKIAEDLGATARKIAANTKKSPFTQIRCSAKRKRR